MDDCLHQDNASAHTALSVKQFLTSQNITVMGRPPYLPDLAPCNFILFRTVKPCLKGTDFTSVEENEKSPEGSSQNLVPEMWEC
ncbi:hypothetical protein TNCV_849151 [Trichonephila clavipes]|uniref:Mariner Mos1 transposase n=1 Tax=Trichonephila clavipes TaxID=2585209 RepID=A0A8X6RRU0_TRICX|nr:hypothetical protein TNCV_849151 [Trichonephila clavipes]